MSLKFCPKCRAIMTPVREGGRSFLKCTKCGYVEELKSDVKLVERVVVNKVESKPIVISKSSEEALPKVKKLCPKCGNEEAYFWVQQTRAADEPPTRFYRCTKCGYTWREYE